MREVFKRDIVAGDAGRHGPAGQRAENAADDAVQWSAAHLNQTAGSRTVGRTAEQAFAVTVEVRLKTRTWCVTRQPDQAPVVTQVAASGRARDPQPQTHAVFGVTGQVGQAQLWHAQLEVANTVRDLHHANRPPSHARRSRTN